MYQVESARTLFRRGARAAASRDRPVGRTVVLLGVTSMFTDLSSEMVATILPIYLVYNLGLSPLQFGFVDGLNNGAAGLVRVIGGGLGDRLRRHKEVAAAGYALSALTRPAFLLVGNATAAISGVVLADRIGKGIRTAPRDALISLSVPADRLGAAFGVHRALDTLGAMLGPLAAFGILAVAADGYDAVFVASFAAAVVGVGVIVLLVPTGGPSDDGSKRRVGLRTAIELFRLRHFRGLSLASCALALATISDAFVYLRLQRSLAFDVRYLPLLFAGTACSYMALAVPLGRLADRIGREVVFVAGYLLLLGVYLVLLLVPGPAMLALVLPLFGAYYAATDGVLAAAASGALPEHARGTGLSLLSTFVNIGRFGGSIAFGLIWVTAGPNVAVAAFAVGLALSLVASSRLLRAAPRV